MNKSNGKGPIYSSSSSVSRKSVDVVADQFPAGLRVLVVDDDPTCLMILERMLRTCLYEVTKCNRAEIALSKLRENKDGFDIVISDVHMPDMDGFKLLEYIGLEMDLPVIMMSADDSKNVVMKGVTHGACDYLIKPVRIEALKNIWQHVVRKRKNEWKDYEQSGSVEECDRPQKHSEDADYSSSGNEGNWKNPRKRKDDEDEAEEREDTSTLKKPRVVWSVDLHQQFVGAVHQLGIDKAVPKKILELMNVHGLTRENVASHLQKYRLYLRRLSGVSPQSNITGSFVNPQEASFGQFTSLSGLDLQTLAATGQLPAQRLATLQAAALGCSTAKSGIPMPVVDQRNVFGFENQKLMFGEGQQQRLGSSKQMNLLHGIPTAIETKQRGNLHSSQSVANINLHASSQGGPGNQTNTLMMQMAQQQSRVQLLNDTSSCQVARLSSSIGQTLLSNGIAANVSLRNGIPENIRGTGSNQVSVASSMLNFPMNTPELPGNSFPLGSHPGISGLTSKGAFQSEVSSEPKGFMQGYGIFNDLEQHKSQSWELQNVGLSYDASQHSNTLQVNNNLASSVLSHQGFSTSQMTGENRNISSIGKGMFLAGDNSQHVNVQRVSQHLNSLPVDNSIRVKAEAVCDSVASNLFPEHFGQDDLMSALLKQQGGTGTAENEFDFDGYSVGNIPV